MRNSRSTRSLSTTRMRRRSPGSRRVARGSRTATSPRTRGRNRRTGIPVPSPGMVLTVSCRPSRRRTSGDGEAHARLPPPWAVLPQEKGSKMRSISAGDAGSVSSTSKVAISPPVGEAQADRAPAAVNFTALPSRLMRIWRTRLPSARTTGGSRRWARKAKLRPLLRACTSNMPTICWRKSGNPSASHPAPACRPRCGRCPGCPRSPTAGGRRCAG